MAMHDKEISAGSLLLNIAEGVVLAGLIFLLGLILFQHRDIAQPDHASEPPASGVSESDPSSHGSANTEAPAGETAEPAPTPTPSPTPTPLSELVFEPRATDATEPSLLIESAEIKSGDEIVESWQSEQPIFFEPYDEYTDMKGVINFRSNNFRNGGAYGTANITEESFEKLWTVPTSALQSYDNTVWTGSGWVGQPLIVEWPRETKAIMNMYDWAKEKDGLVEVIYATMDGNIYFIDLETGEFTRNTLYIGYTFKGAGTLDPRGWPIMYVGAGYNSKLGLSRAFAISLIDGSVLFDFGNNDSFAYRSWYCFDGAPLVDAETDTLLWAGESGVFYIIKLNTKYDEAAGTLTMEPETVKWRYKGVRTGTQYWVGMETSLTAWQGYAFFGDNGGNLMCIDLNTLTLVWAQDTLDDTNSTPVLSVEDGHPYLYISTSFHGGWRASSTSRALIPIWKIDAVTGEIVWANESYKCYTEDAVSGGVQGTMAVGEHDLAGMVFVPLARTPSAGGGILAALDVETGEAIWELDTQSYSWSSPVAVYTDSGKGYLIYPTAGGYMYIVDGLTGEILSDINLGSTTEASPAVYNDTLVIGTRGQLIYGIKLK